MLEQPDEEVDEVAEPAYDAYAYARGLLDPSSRVLDIGCGNAKVSLYLAGSGATVDGIEPAANRASIARQRVRHLSTIVPTEGDDPELLSQYDLITFFDVLEHIVDPTELLAWSVRRLAPGGSILAVIPNSANYAFRLKIARGDWSMSDWGLFDRTHVRFYDTKTAAQLRPQGTVEAERRFFTVDQGWRSRAMSLRPNLFALHVALLWTKYSD